MVQHARKWLGAVDAAGKRGVAIDVDQIRLDERAKELQTLRTSKLDLVRRDPKRSETRQGPPRIRVLFLVPQLHVGGAEKVTLQVAQGLDPDRFEVSLLCTGPEGELLDCWISADINAKAIDASGKKNIVRLLYLVLKNIRTFGPDVVVMQGDGPSVVGRLAAVFANVRHRILWIHYAIDVRGGPRKFADRFLTPVTSIFLGVAETQRQFMTQVCRFPDEKIHIIHNGVDLSALRVHHDRTPLAPLGIEPESAVVGMVARLHPVKDHETFLRAARIVLESEPETRFLIVGDGPRRTELISRCRELGVEKSVYFTGTRADVGDLLRAIDVAVLSSHSECLPMAVLEAMACGRPVVCTNVGGMPEIVEHGVSGFLATPRDPEGLAAYILELLTTPDLREAMGAAARRRVESEFDERISIAAVQKLLEGLAESSGPTKTVRTRLGGLLGKSRSA